MLSKFIPMLLSLTMATPLSAMEATHLNLWRTIEDVGVNIELDNKYKCENGIAGLYYSQKKLLIICTRDGVMRANDYDTLRHEAQHIIQDCMANAIGDGILMKMLIDQDDFLEFVVRGLTVKERTAIFLNYAEDGNDIIELELEAFAVAKNISPNSIAEKVKEVCEGK